MKRPRDEPGGISTPLKRPTGPPIISPGNGEPKPYEAPASGQRLTTDDALAYLKAVKDKFRDDKVKYDEFLEVMKDFRAQRIDTAGVIARVKDLFKGHRQLILGFNTFLPKGYEITLPPEEEAPAKKPVEFDQAINYVNKIKTRFATNEHVYKSFLEILNMYRKGSKTITEVYEEVATLFKDHNDLLEEFTYFLPDSSPAPAQMPEPARGAGRMNLGFGRKRDEGAGPSEKRALLPKVKKEKFSTGPARAEDRAFLRVPKEEDEKYKRDKKDDRQQEKRELYRERDREKERFVRDRKREDDGDRDLDALQRHKRKSARRAEEQIRKQSHSHGEPGEGPPEATDLGAHMGTGVDEKRATKTSISLQKELAFFDKVKSRLRNKEVYQEFLKCLNLFSQEIISRQELHGLVGDILGKFPDLMEGFNDFLSRCENLELNMEEQIKPRLDKPAPGRDVLAKDWRTSQMAARVKDLHKPISELDFSQAERCTPSYRLLPKTYPRPIASYRTELCRNVLNDNWVSVTSGSEDYSFKHMRKNQYEESLFRCEDDRYELDMLLESTSSTAKKVQDLVDRVHNLDDDDRARLSADDFLNGKTLNSVNVRCMERIYGDHGLDILELLRKNPVVALPVILGRLKQKQEEWVRCRHDMNKVWAEVYAKNFHKSLDHRSFYFKQNDKKTLSTKGLLSEVRELSEKKHFADDLALAVVAGNRRLLVPDMTYSYPDKEVHEQLYKILRFSAQEMMSREQAEKLMRFWTSFIEPLLDVEPMNRGLPDAQETAPARPPAIERAAKPRHESNKGNGVADSSKAEQTAVGKAPEKEQRKDSGEAKREEKTASGAEQEPKEAPVEAGDVTDQISGPAFDGEVPGGPPAVQANGPAEVATAEADEEREEGELSPGSEGEKQGDREQVVANGVKQKPTEPGANEEAPRAGDGDAEADDEGEPEAGAPSPEDSEENTEEENEPSEMDEDEEEGDQEVDGDGEGEGEGDADEYDENGGLAHRLFSGCKPLTARALVELEDKKAGAGPTHLFFANDVYYVLLRLHQILYERILAAKTSAAAAAKRWEDTKGTPPPRSYYDRFFTILFNLLDGTIENSNFEDECRAMLGTSSYVLFTLDKLIAKLVKQLQLAAADELSSKVLALYAYERSRDPDCIDDVVYHVNASILLDDENCYRFEYNPSSGEMSIQLMDGGPEKLEPSLESMDEGFAGYLTDFLISDVERRSTVYLARNLKKGDKHGDPDLPLVEALKEVRIWNGLECKVACSTSKVSYVLDTEDLLFRRKRGGRLQRGAVKTSSKSLGRRHKYCLWLEGGLGGKSHVDENGTCQPGPR